MARYIFDTIISAQDWAWPAGETTATIQCRGSGGSSDNGDVGATTDEHGGGGGGGGAYSRTDLSKGVEDHLVWGIDAAGNTAGDGGGDAYVSQNGSTVCLAKGGLGASGHTGGYGGSKDDGIGDYKNNGGHGSHAPLILGGDDVYAGGCGGNSGGLTGSGDPLNADYDLGPGHGFIGHVSPATSAKNGKGGDGGLDGEDGSLGTLHGSGGGGGGRNGAFAGGRRGQVIIDCPAWKPGVHGVGCCCMACKVEKLAIPETIYLNVVFEKATPEGLGTIPSEDPNRCETSCEVGFTIPHDITTFQNDAWMSMIEAASPIQLDLIDNSSGDGCCNLSYAIKSSATVCGGTSVPNSLLLGTAPDGSFSVDSVTANCTDTHGASGCQVCTSGHSVEPGEYILQLALDMTICSDGTYDISYSASGIGYQYSHVEYPISGNPCSPADGEEPADSCGPVGSGNVGGIEFGGAASGTIVGDWNSAKLAGLTLDGSGGTGSDAQSSGVGCRCVDIQPCSSDPFGGTTCLAIQTVEAVTTGRYAFDAVHATIGF